MEKDKKISELGKLETVTGEEVALVEKGKKNYGLPMSLLAKASDLEEVNKSIAGIRSDISDLQIQDNYGVASWSEDDLAPECTGFFGSWEFLNKWNVYLLDTTDNAGETTTPVGKLMRNNLFRFEDGSFAPTVGITEEMRSECDVELYLDEAHQQKYCDAGAVLLLVGSQVWIGFNVPLVLCSWIIYLIATLMAVAVKNEKFIAAFLHTKPLFWVEVVAFLNLYFCLTVKMFRL